MLFRSQRSQLEINSTRLIQLQISKKSFKRSKVRMPMTNTAKSTIPREDRNAINEADSEYERRGNFRRIFPTTHYSYYRAFFESERHLNLVLANNLVGYCGTGVDNHMLGRKERDYQKKFSSRIGKLPSLKSNCYN